MAGAYQTSLFAYQGTGLYAYQGEFSSVPTTITYDNVGPRRKSYKREFEEDFKAVLAELEHVAKSADVITEAKEVVLPKFEPAQARISAAMIQGLALVHDALGALERTQLQMALAKAREAERALQARREAAIAEERARLEAEAAVRRARKRKAAAFIAAYLLADDE